jgi:hypothetical protein
LGSVSVPPGQAGPKPPGRIGFHIRIQRMRMGRLTLIPFTGAGVLPVDGPVPVQAAVAVAVVITIDIGAFIAEIVAVKIIALDIGEIVKKLAKAAQ